MGLADLFKSTKQKERERQRAMRKALNEAKSALNTVNARVNTLRKERDAAWEDAREKLVKSLAAIGENILWGKRGDSKHFLGKTEI